MLRLCNRSLVFLVAMACSAGVATGVAGAEPVEDVPVYSVADFSGDGGVESVTSLVVGHDERDGEVVSEVRSFTAGGAAFTSTIRTDVAAFAAAVWAGAGAGAPLPTGVTTVSTVDDTGVPVSTATTTEIIDWDGDLVADYRTIIDFGPAVGVLGVDTNLNAFNIVIGSDGSGSAPPAACAVKRRVGVAALAQPAPKQATCFTLTAGLVRGRQNQRNLTYNNLNGTVEFTVTPVQGSVPRRWMVHITRPQGVVGNRDCYNLSINGPGMSFARATRQDINRDMSAASAIGVVGGAALVAFTVSFTCDI
jgi:hypothetical protein